MDFASDISTCQKLLDELQALERIEDSTTLIRLENTYHHLPPQTAPRLQKALNECISRSEEILATLFDKVEISDKSLLNALLRTFLAYGNFRIAQINYHIESPRDETEPDVRFTPVIVKIKWYDMTPLLPQAGSVGWKAIVIHGLVKDPMTERLRTTCQQLLLQKLQFYASISKLDRFKHSIDLLQRNGERVAEEIARQVFDAASDDQEQVQLDNFIFDLLLPFTTLEQQTALIQAVIEARFRSHASNGMIDKNDGSNRRLDKLISHCIMNDAILQEIFYVKLVENLRYNIIRRKRRLSNDSEDIESSITLESILTAIISGTDPCQTLASLANVQVVSKSLQKSYLNKWVIFTRDILTKKTLTPRSATVLLVTCSTILVACSKHIDKDLSNELAFLLAKSIDTTNYKKLDKLFRVCGTNFLVEQTKLFASHSDLLDDFETPVIRYYRSFFNKHMRLCTIRHFQKDVEKFSAFVTIVCDKAVGRSKSTILGYIYISELSELLSGNTGKATNKTIELYVEYGLSICKKLHSFIKHRPFVTRSVDVDGSMVNGLTNGIGNGGHVEEVTVSEEVQFIVIDALVCILRIALDRNEQTMLDTYGELMLKLYNLVVDRVEAISLDTKNGRTCSRKPIDDHLPRLCNLYNAHRTIMEPYLTAELNKEICQKLLSQEYVVEQDDSNDEASAKRKTIYKQIKSKLESLQERDNLIYQTIINRQYVSIVDHNLGQHNDHYIEESCCKKSANQLMTLSKVISISSGATDSNTYDKVLKSIVKQFETCDALDHPRVLNLFHALAALIPKNHKTSEKSANIFKKAFPNIGCNLIRLAKSVELGPSVLSFTNSGTHNSIGAIQCCTYSNCIRIYTIIFSQYPTAYTNNLITDALHICISSNLICYAKPGVRLHKLFIQLALSIASLLKAISMGKRNIVEHSMPVFLSVLSLLIRCLLLASDRQKWQGIPELQNNGHGGGDQDAMDTDSIDPSETKAIEKEHKIFESQLECLSRDIGRLLNNLCSLETKLVDYAPHLICSYIKDTQLASCPEFVKKHLDEGIFRIFNLVDSYQKDRMEQVTDEGVQRKTTAGRASGSMFEMIHARLDQASREIFKDMHDNYNKFHRYLGKC